VQLIQEVFVESSALERYRGVVDDAQLQTATTMAGELREQLAGRVVWNINSTAAGGGVAEMLHRLVGYGRAVGLDARWLVITGDTDFFRVTKRLHNALHGSRGDGTPLGRAEVTAYEATLDANFGELAELLGPRDVVILHDPQTAGLIPHLRPLGARVIWRCHIGVDDGNEQSEQAWRFLEPYVTQAHACVFSRERYAPDYIDRDRLRLITPNIDPFSPKNQDLSKTVVHAILSHVGLIHDGGDPQHRSYLRSDGTPRRVERHVAVVRSADAPPWDAPLVTQVSRWDRLKDPIGVMRGFVRFLHAVPASPAHLVLAGPQCAAVSDDPEGREAFEEVVDAWGALDHAVRARVHLASIPMDDMEENAAIVNALQRHAAVVVQKSLREGFGLTVTEAMWKGRPVIATAVGGIQDQIVDKRSGVLVHDPTDEREFADALEWVLSDSERAASLGEAARERVREKFLGLGSLLAWGELLADVTDGG
jgi:trehalose synthase